MGGDEWTGSSVASLVDETALKQNEILRETRRISSECKRELTVRPVVQLHGLVRRCV